MVWRSLVGLSCALLLCATSAGAAGPVLAQPMDVLPLPGGVLAVTDRLEGAVYVIDSARKSGRRVARVPEARELERLPDGRLLVSSGADVLALDLRTGRARRYARAAGDLLGIARGRGETLYGSEDGKTVVRLRPAPRTVLATGLNGVHGITVLSDALVLAESYTGRVLRLDLATREISVLAKGLGNPSFTLPVRTGGFYVSEFAADRLSRLRPDGSVTKVADVRQPGPIAFDAKRRVVGVTLAGTIYRVEGGRARAIYP